MSSTDERRKGLRAALPAEFYFNVLSSEADFTRGQFSILRRLSTIDSVRVDAKTESQQLLSRIDQKLSLLIGLLAEKSSRKSYTNHGVVLDISEYGLAFGHAMEFPDGAVIEIGLQLPKTDNRLMDIAGRIVHVKNVPEPNAGLAYVYGVEFSDIQGQDQNDIVQWIFAHQREQIRRRRELSA
ncbi:MAG: PilZ domain-containing protein [Candidatus Adiutrix sp.]|jgi:c-di-GMP-binding flagellar brake protein YcgR|nr:PilZ domain-containing protein [Candidatus Adiutrix sp.]